MFEWERIRSVRADHAGEQPRTEQRRSDLLCARRQRPASYPQRASLQRQDAGMQVRQPGRVQRLEVAIRDLPVQHPPRLLEEVALVEIVDANAEQAAFDNHAGNQQADRPYCARKDPIHHAPRQY